MVHTFQNYNPDIIVTNLGKRVVVCDFELHPSYSFLNEDGSTKDFKLGYGYVQNCLKNNLYVVVGRSIKVIRNNFAREIVKEISTSSGYCIYSQAGICIIFGGINSNVVDTINLKIHFSDIGELDGD